MSARSLERAFHEVADCSPRQFIKARRLNASRHASVESGPEDTSVKAVAIDCGFPGKGWFVYFRIYGPEAFAFDGSWKPADFEKVQ